MDISAYQHLNIRMSTRGKRPLRNLTPSDKVRAIQRIHNGETKASVSRDIGVPESTLRGWCKNEQKLRFMCRQLGAADQITVMPVAENPPEKRPRFDNHIQSPKYPGSSNFNDFGFNRCPLSGLSFPTNSTNAILEKIAYNEIMKKHMLTAEYSTKPLGENISDKMSGMIGGSITAAGVCNSQLSLMENLNLLSLFNTNVSAISNNNVRDTVDNMKNKAHLRIMDQAIDDPRSNTYNNIHFKSNKNNNESPVSSLSVKNWAKDPAEKTSSSFTNQNNINIGLAKPAAKNIHIAVSNGSNNNRVNSKSNSISFEVASNVLNFPPALSLGLLQIPNANNTCDSESGSSSALLEWCKVFNASLNFLALAATAAALQPNASISKSVKKGDNILYKELTKTANNSISFVSSDSSNDSYFESEPEDLSVRSTVTSKLSSPANSRSISPVKSNGSCSPFRSDDEH